MEKLLIKINTLCIFGLLPPSEEDGEHAYDGDGRPYDPEEEASRNLLDTFQHVKWNGEVYDEENNKPQHPPPQGLSHLSPPEKLLFDAPNCSEDGLLLSWEGLHINSFVAGEANIVHFSWGSLRHASTTRGLQ
jgi:hypothetical protein